MQAILQGFAKLDFTSADGNRVEGTNLYISFPDKNVTGQKCERIFASKEIVFPEKIKIGDTLNFSFNNKGKLETITANN